MLLACKKHAINKVHKAK